MTCYVHVRAEGSHLTAEGRERMAGFPLAPLKMDGYEKKLKDLAFSEKI